MSALQKGICIALSVLMGMMVGGSAAAALFEVRTAAELHDALAAAETNREDDRIHLLEGEYSGCFEYNNADGPETFQLIIAGGYRNDFTDHVNDPSLTVVDGSGAGIPLRLENGGTEGSFFSVEDITLQNGYAAQGTKGAGLYVDNPAGTTHVSRTIVQGNISEGEAGGIFLSAHNIFILQNTIRHNSAGGSAGAIQIPSTSTYVEIADNVVTDNHCDWATGGIMAGGTEVKVYGNIIDHNWSNYFGAGGLNVSARDSLLVINNQITNNWESGSCGLCGSGGGGLLTVSNGYIKVINNTIAFNSSAKYGGGLTLSLQNVGRTADIYNNIFWSNGAAEAGNDLYVLYDADDTVHLYYNNLDQSPSGLYLAVPFPVDPSNLNALDPLFEDPEGSDVHLSGVASPCVNSGDNNAPALPPTDLDKAPRIIYDIVDMGAYEFPGHRLTRASFYIPGAWTSPDPLLAYRLVGIPAKPLETKDVFDILKGFFGGHADPSYWRLFAHRNGVYEEIVSSGQSDIAYGRGWWIICGESRDVVVAGLPLDVDYDGFHLQGWQIFACPFHDQPVNWASVCADENNRSLALGETIYGWPGVDGNYMALDEIEPGTSAFIYVGAAAGGHLHIPIGGQALSVRNASSWRPDPFGPDQPPPPLPPGAHIHIDFPNGGERFVKGQSFLVEWTSSGIQPPNFLSYIVLEISTDGGRSYRRIRPPFPNTGRYPWRIPPGVPASTQCLLRATSTLYPEVSDTSDAAFAVVNNVQ